MLRKEPLPAFSLLGLTILLLLACFPVFAAEPIGAVNILTARDLSPALKKIFDVRWADDESVYLGSSKRGVIQVSIDSKSSQHKVVMPAGVARSGWGYSRLGLSQKYMAGAPTAFFVAWHELPRGPVNSEYFEVIADLDVFEDKLVLVGARKGDDQQYSPDGAIAWIGSLERDLDDLKPVLFSAAGAGARPMDACGLFGLSKTRFLQDGSFLILPGVEPGLYLYSGAGKLLRTWQTDNLGIDAECGLSDEEMYHLSADLDARTEWVNQRRTVDEILPLPEGPGLILRKTSGTATTWQLKMLGIDRDVKVVDLPFSGSSPHWHLRADLRGQRIVFLLLEYVAQPVTPSRLIVTTLPQEAQKP